MTRVLLLGCALLAGQITGSPELDAEVMAEALASKLKDYSARVIVPKYKSGWQKEYLGASGRRGLRRSCYKLLIVAVPDRHSVHLADKDDKDLQEKRRCRTGD